MTDGRSACDLPVIDVSAEASPSTSRPLGRVRTVAMLSVRWLMLIGLVGALQAAAQQRRERREADAAPVRVPAAMRTAWFGTEAVEMTFDAAQGRALIWDGARNLLGSVVETLPAAKTVTGYRGVNNLQVAIDPEDTIVGIRLLWSEDTADHVEAIRRSKHFFDQFVGQRVAAALDDVDVVSGATLTSLAMSESIAVRWGERVPASARFPDALTEAECRAVFPEAAECLPHPLLASARRVQGADGTSLGMVLRTGPLNDRINGYQGPSELRLGFDPQGRLQQVRVRETFDNQPYASYVADEPWYWDPFLGKTMGELAEADLQALGIEGVSGATMSTVAAAETLIAAAGEAQRLQQEAAQPSPSPRRPLHWSWKETTTLAFLAGALWMGLGRSPQRRRLRRLWQVALVAGFGLVTGNLVSIALLLGWGSGGLPWRLAPGLAAVVAVALAIPTLTKAPLYCAQLCPHGVLQQWLIRRGRFRLRISPRWNRVLLAVPGALCVAAYLVALTGMPVDLATWEPFDAYLVWTAVGGSAIVAILSLGLAALSPMGYCRFACPTGRVLTYTRRHARSGRREWSDVVVLMLLGGAWRFVLW